MNTAFAPVGSYLYRTVRARAIKKVYAQQEREGRQRDLEEVVEIGDQKLKKLPQWLYSFPIPDGIGVQFHDLYFPSPLTLASFKEDLDIINRWMLLGLGGACIKTVMREPREGNQRPRLQEVTVNGCEGLINAMGLPGKGVEKVIENLEHAKLFDHQRPIGVSIGGNSLEEYKFVFNRLNFVAQERKSPHYFEIKSSCPNTPEGQQMTKHLDLLERLVDYMRQHTPRVVGVKCSPEMSNQDLQSCVEMLKKYGKTYLNLGNTSSRTCEEVGLPENAISIGKGGLSGPALFNRTYDMIAFAAPIKIPLIATGGIDSAEKVRALQELAEPYNTPLIIGMATAVVKDMYCIPKINRALASK